VELDPGPELEWPLMGLMSRAPQGYASRPSAWTWARPGAISKPVWGISRCRFGDLTGFPEVLEAPGPLGEARGFSTEPSQVQGHLTCFVAAASSRPEDSIDSPAVSQLGFGRTRKSIISQAHISIYNCPGKQGGSRPS
jgi:hypothetical protein